MSFTDLDPVEQVMGKAVTAMTDTELVTYLRLAVLYHQDIELAVDGLKERSVMAGLKRTYGRDAGLIVKWVCWHYQGRFRGEVITPFSFTKARKWFTDKMHVEMQQHRKAQSQLDAASHAAQGFAKLTDL